MRRALGLMSGTSLDGIDVALVETDGARAREHRPGADDRLSGRVSRAAARVAGRGRPGRRGRSRADPAPRRGGRAFSRTPPADRGRSRRLSRPHDPALPGRAPHLAIGRRRRLGAPARDRRRRRFPLGRRRGGRRGRAVGAAVPCGARRGTAKAARRPQSRRRRQCDVDRRRGIAEEPKFWPSTPGPAMPRSTTGCAGIPAPRPISAGRWRMPGRRARRMSRDFVERGYFARKPPKSLDRDEFRDAVPDGLSLEDGVATLTEMTAAAVAAARRHFPAPAREWLVCGGGRHNPALMAALARRLGARCARSRRSAGTATRSRRRPLPISRSARRPGCRSACPRPPACRSRCAAAGCSPAADCSRGLLGGRPVRGSWPWRRPA